MLGTTLSLLKGEKLSKTALFRQKKQLREDVTAVHNYLMHRR